LSIPFVAMTRFVDPAVNFGVSFEKATADDSKSVVDPALDQANAAAPDDEADTESTGDTVISLDAFRRK